jgi:hypothetical protein
VVATEAAVGRRAGRRPSIGGRAPAAPGRAVARDGSGGRTALALAHRGPSPAAPAPIRMRLAAGPAAAGGALLLWSLTYLARQARPAGVAVASPLGDVALEGVALALAWLAALLAAGLGAAAASSPSASGGRPAAVTTGRPAGGAARAARRGGPASPVPLRAVTRGPRLGRAPKRPSQQEQGPRQGLPRSPARAA